MLKMVYTTHTHAPQLHICNTFLEWIYCIIRKFQLAPEPSKCWLAKMFESKFYTIHSRHCGIRTCSSPIVSCTRSGFLIDIVVIVIHSLSHTHIHKLHASQSFELRFVFHRCSSNIGDILSLHSIEISIVSIYRVFQSCWIFVRLEE